MTQREGTTVRAGSEGARRRSKAGKTMLAGNGADNGGLAAYLAQINKVPLLSVEEEQVLARKFRDTGDLDAGHRLVTSNLRFVVKVSFEYRSYGFRMADLVQEGNIGLMKAVQKFDPDRKIRLISYGVWWIRAYIQNYILRNWSLVKLGTTQAQRKLFFSLARTRRELERQGEAGSVVAETAIARRLRVKQSEVAEMSQRLDGRDLSLDAPMGDDGGSSHLDLLEGGAVVADHALEAHEVRTLARRRVSEALSRLDARERFIIEQRLMTERPMTLSELGAHYRLSRERARQLEIRAKAKLREELAQTMGEVWDTTGPESSEESPAL